MVIHYIDIEDHSTSTGIYISRVSVARLAPIMSVGDEILAVNGQTVKGKALTDVQTMIQQSNTVTLALRPPRLD